MSEQHPPGAPCPSWAEYVARREHVLGSLRQVLARQLRFSRQLDELDADAPLFGSGFGLDSLDAVELSVHVESAFGVRISEKILLRGALRSLNTLVDLVLSVQGVPRTPASDPANLQPGQAHVARK